MRFSSLTALSIYAMICFFCSCGQLPDSKDKESGSSSNPPKKQQHSKEIKPLDQPKLEHIDTKSLKLDEPKVCDKILDQFKNPDQTLVNTNTFKKRLSLKKDLRSVSKSGAFPSLVSDQDTKIKFLKIFPKIKKNLSEEQIAKDPNYLEMFHTCRVAKLNLTTNLPEDIPASTFFADVYEMGFLKTNDPFAKPDQSDDHVYPYLLSEAVDNVTMTKLATEPVETKKALGFDLNSSPPMVLESILLQILVALKNPHSAWQLTHNDLHTGNILIAKNEKADFAIHFQGKKMQLVGPLIKIIDFGLGTTAEDREPSIWISNRPFIAELESFIKAVHEGPISPRNRFNIQKVSVNPDIRMFNLIVRALKNTLNNRGSNVPPKKYCHDYDDCLKLMSAWWK